MSKVISFRLDVSKPREAQALEILNAWTMQGYNLRFILTSALLTLSHPNSNSEMNKDEHALNAILDQISLVFEILKTIQPDRSSKQHHDIPSTNLSESFLALVKNTVKSGIRPGE